MPSFKQGKCLGRGFLIAPHQPRTDNGEWIEWVHRYLQGPVMSKATSVAAKDEKTFVAYVALMKRTVRTPKSGRSLNVLPS